MKLSKIFICFIIKVKYGQPMRLCLLLQKVVTALIPSQKSKHTYTYVTSKPCPYPLHLPRGHLRRVPICHRASCSISSFESILWPHRGGKAQTGSTRKWMLQEQPLTNEGRNWSITSNSSSLTVTFRGSFHPISKGKTDLSPLSCLIASSLASASWSHSQRNYLHSNPYLSTRFVGSLNTAHLPAAGFYPAYLPSLLITSFWFSPPKLYKESLSTQFLKNYLISITLRRENQE